MTTCACNSVFYALGRLHAAEAFAGHIICGSTKKAGDAIDDALAELIAARAGNRFEVIGKLDRAWQFYADRDPSVGEALGEVASRVAAGQPFAHDLAQLAASLKSGVYADLVYAVATDAAALEAVH